MPKVTLELGFPIEFSKVDSTLTIPGKGELVISKGSVEWLPSGNSVNGRSFTYAQFAKALGAGGTPFKFQRITQTIEKTVAFKTDPNGAKTKQVAAKAIRKKTKTT
ncbi:hypothetical protein [Cupriavidus sp. D384]|uniref:hypothetical protein n=1 Tax=Cupriavidus sp. D384 TaxID=1538095 RepID=UPI00082BA644|nr:hypothetical protein [Cupriavidus sp. D384]